MRMMDPDPQSRIKENLSAEAGTREAEAIRSRAKGSLKCKMDCCIGKKQQRSLYQTSGLLDKSRPLVYKKMDNCKAA